MESEIITALVGLFCTTVSSIVTFFLTRRKYNTEVDSQQIENMSKSFEIYKHTMEETLEAQKRMTDATVKAQNEKIASLQKDYDTLKTQYNQLQNQNNQLQNQVINLLMGKKIPDIGEVLNPKAEEE